MNLEKDIQTAIEANLPAATAKILAQRLSIGELAIAENADLKTRNKELAAELELYKNLEKEDNAKRVGLDAKTSSLAEREKKLFEAEIITKVTTEERQKSKEDIFRLVETVFKNPVVRQHSNTQVPVFMPYAGGGGNYSHQHQASTSETEVEGTR